MKKLMVLILLSMCSVGLLLSCASLTQRTIPSWPKEITPGTNEAEVVVQNASSMVNGLLNVFIDGEMIAQVDQNGSERFIIPNGNHSIMVQQILFGKVVGLKTNVVKFTANSNRIVFKTSSIFLYFAVFFRISKTGEFALGTAESVGRIAGRTSLIEMDGALQKSTDSLIEELKQKLPQGATIAILAVYSDNLEVSSYTMEKLEQLLYDARHFTIIEKRFIDAVRRDKQLQESDDIDPATAAALGEEEGWNVVVIGEVSGSGSSRRLTLRAIDSGKGTILARTMENF